MHAGRPRAVCPSIDDPSAIGNAYARYLKDESNLIGGLPRRLLFPRSVDELAEGVRTACQRGESLTVCGGRTGIVGGAVPVGGESLLCLDALVADPVLRYSERHDCWSVRVKPGTSLDSLTAFLAAPRQGGPSPGGELFYPVDPTEGSATLGGTVATNASGSRTLFFGPTRAWVLGLTVVLADGSVARLERGETGCRDGLLRVPLLPDSPSGDEISLRVPAVRMPRTKHVAGYHLSPDMEPIDLFIGGEGTLGIVAEIDLRLCGKPAHLFALSVFAPSSLSAWDLASALGSDEELRPLALEFMDGNSLELLRAYRAEAGEASGVPVLPDAIGALLYVEYAYPDEPALDRLVETVRGRLSAAGVPEDATWAAFEDSEREAMRKMRHALPERVNALIARRKESIPEITKLSTDLAVPGPRFSEMLGIYSRLLDESGLQHVVFGHIGDAHLHVNILPRDSAEVARGKEVTVLLAREAVRLGGSVSGEHGIGKLKKHLMEIQYPEADRAALRALKTRLDPDGRLNPGVLW